MWAKQRHNFHRKTTMLVFPGTLLITLRTESARQGTIIIKKETVASIGKNPI